MIQKEYFKKINTRHLLSFRRQVTCKYPRFEGDVELGYVCGSWLGYKMDWEALSEELSTRPHVSTGDEAKLLRKLKSDLKMTEEEIRKIPEYRKLLAEAEKNNKNPKPKSTQ